MKLSELTPCRYIMEWLNGSCPQSEVIGVARTAGTMGVAWSMDEVAFLVDNLQAGMSLDELTTELGRTPAAIMLRLQRMIPADENIDPDAALPWLLARFAVEPDYDWRAVLTTRLAQDRQARSGLAPRTSFTRPIRRPAVPRTRRHDRLRVPAEQMRRIWQDVVGAVLSPQRAELFAAHPDLPSIGYFPEDRIRAAGEQLYRHAGELRISSWARECTFDGGGTTSLTWAQVCDPGSDAAIVVRDLLDAAVGGLAAPRNQRIIIERLGLHGEPARTLRAIATDLSLSRERVRQLQEQAFKQLRRRYQPPKPAQYVGQIFADVLDQASNAGVDLPHALLAVTDAAALTGPKPLLVRAIAALARRNDQVMRQVAAGVETLAARRRAEIAHAARDAAAIERASRRVAEMLEDAEWPETPVVLPDSLLIRPLRSPQDREGAGTWTSPALGRDVAYESTAELQIIKTLERARQIGWFCEQPVAIPYTFDGWPRTYYPDLVAVTDDSRCLLIEVKPQTDMALAINLAKTQAARAFCTRRGWGYLCTDGRRTLRGLQNVVVPEPAAQAITEALRDRKRLTWSDTAPIRAEYAITGVHLAALVIQRGWDLRLGPYRITADPQTSTVSASAA